MMDFVKYNQYKFNYYTLHQDLYIYKIFDGTWFNTKYAIENTWKEKRVVLLFPETMYPQTEEQMLKFPLLDVLKANMEYKEEDYASFMQQYNLPQKFASFIKRNITEIMSNKISSILNGHFTVETFSEDVVGSVHLTWEKRDYWNGALLSSR